MRTEKQEAGFDAPRLRTRIIRQLNIVGMSEADKEDVSQSVFVALLSTKCDVQCVESWAVVVARRIAYSQLRKRGRNRCVELGYGDEPLFTRELETVIDVQRALETSHDNLCQLILGRYLEECGLEELAKITELSRSTVQRHLNGERRRLQKRLKH